MGRRIAPRMTRGVFPWRAARAGLLGFVLLTFLYLVLPTFVVLPLSFSSQSFLSFPPPGFSLRWYRAFADSLDYRWAIWNSVLIGVPVALFATISGTMAALALTRGHMPFRRMIGSLMLAPLILPQIVLALGLFPIMARFGLIGSYPAIVIAHTIVTMPLAIITVAASLKSYAPTLETAAMTMGADPWRAFCFITFPLIRPGMAVGFIFAFAFSFDELILAIFLTSPATRTVPRLLWEQLNYQVTPVIAAATVILMTGTLCLLLGGALINRIAERRLRSAAL
jgi:ABC-type spermidine/putrescine transport system permease subunit II